MPTLEEQVQTLVAPYASRRRRQQTEEEQALLAQQTEEQRLADELRKTTADVFRRTRTEANLDLQRRGLAQAGEAGATTGFLAENETKKFGQIDTDLTTKLSNIAARIRSAREIASEDIGAYDLDVRKRLMAEEEARRAKASGSGSGLGSGTAELLSKLFGAGQGAAGGAEQSVGSGLPNLQNMSTLQRIAFFRGTGEFTNPEITELNTGLDAAFAGQFYNPTSQKVRDALNEILQASGVTPAVAPQARFSPATLAAARGALRSIPAVALTTNPRGKPVIGKDSLINKLISRSRSKKK